MGRRKRMRVPRVTEDIYQFRATLYVTRQGGNVNLSWRIAGIKILVNRGNLLPIVIYSASIIAALFIVRGLFPFFLFKSWNISGCVPSRTNVSTFENIISRGGDLNKFFIRSNDSDLI